MAPPSIYTVIRETWLNRKLDVSAVSVAAGSTLLMVIAALLQWNDVRGVASLMPASGEAVFVRGEYWRLWSALFAHADLGHLVSNSFLFFIVGIFLSGYFGILVFPLGALFMGGVTNLIVLRGMPPATQLLGVSGVVFWMGGFWLALYFMLERRKSLTQRTLRATGVALGLFMPAEAFDPSISYAAHFVGFLLGVGTGMFYFQIRKRSLRSAERVEIVVESDDEQPDDNLRSRTFVQ